MPENLVVLKNCGKIDPRDISGYLARSGFKALAKARTQMGPSEVLREIKASGLRGRGGAGFPCGVKWEMAANVQNDKKYFVCNADEGEVGTFKDRYILENDPFTLIEGIAIGGFAIGATVAYLYLREEYTFLLGAVESAIEQARQQGFLDFMEVRVVHGAGAYICGEESALLESIEGKRGESRYRPPFPTEAGLFGKPTVVNNVETLMNIPGILLNGADWFRSMGTESSKGTKVFSISGDVERPGVYELTMGSKLSEVVIDCAGAKEVQMVQVGGASGRIIPGHLLDTPLSYETALGSGAVTVMDMSRDIIDVIHHTVRFFAEESCGKCAPCREGTEALLEILDRISSGDGRPEDIRAMEELAEVMKSSSLCGLGQSAPTPLLDSLTYYRDAFENRIAQAVHLRGLRGIQIR